MSLIQLLRLLVTLLAFGVLAGGAAAANPFEEGAPPVVFEEGDGGDEDGEEGGDEGEGEDELFPTSDDGAEDDDADTEEKDKEEGADK